MSFIAENDSWNYGGIILSDTTLTQWNRTYYDIFASTGNITITLPAVPDIFNDSESGLLCFIRADSDISNTVTIVANIDGLPKNIPIYPNPNAVHRFRTIYDPSGTLVKSTIYDTQLGDSGEGSERVQRLPVETVALTNLDINANNYIGLVVTGFTLAVGSSLLLANQNDTSQNGVYRVIASGNIVHRSQEPLGTDGKYYTFPVTRGDAAGIVYQVTNADNPDAPAIFGGSRLSISGYTVAAQGTLTGLSGDVTSTSPVAGVAPTTVVNVGNKTAAQVVQSVDDTIAATTLNISNTLVKRDSSGSVALSQATLASKATTATQIVRFDQLPTVDTLNVYLSSVGNDTTNVGTVISPFLTLSKGESVVTGSGNIWLSTGTYSDSVTVTKDNILWSCPSNVGNYKATLTGTLNLTGSSVRRSFMGLQFITGTNQCVTHTSTKGIMNFENCGFVSSNATPLSLGSNLNTPTFNYFRDCDFSGLTNPISLGTNTSNSFTMTTSANSPNITLNSGTLTSGSFITSTVFPAGTVVLGNISGNNWLLSRNATSSGSSTGYNAILWYITNCNGLKLSIGTGHLVLGYNNPLVSLSGNTLNYLETSNPLVTTVATQSAMLSQTAATFGGIGFMTKVTSDATLANNGLWQCAANPINSLTNWVKIAGSGNDYVAGAGVTIDTGNVIRTSYAKTGADFTVSLSPQRVFRDIMWFSGSSTAVRTWTPGQIPWVYSDITAAELACTYWIQRLTMFFKDMENDNQYDSLIGALPSFIVSRITGNTQVPDSGTDMDNNVGAVTTYAGEWFELIVGRNAAGTELYTMSFTLALMSSAAFDIATLYPFRIIWQTTRGASMAGFSGQGVAAISGSQPRCTQYGASGVTIPTSGFPIWAIPVSIETIF
jgi:hypothetical protein